MYTRILDKIRNAPLAKKFLMLLLPGILLLSGICFLGFFAIIRSGNHTLYETAGELLAYSSRDISGSLNSVQNMANFILEDSSIQNSLSATKDSIGGTTPSNAYSTIQASLNTYYQRYKADYVDYIQILNNKFSVLSSSLDSHVMPQSLQENLTQIARQGDGRLCWVTDYQDTYGIFLVRIIKRIEGLKLDELGILLVNINVNHMLEDISSTSVRDNSISYILCKGEQFLYVPENLKDLSSKELSRLPETSFKIQELCGEKYFVVPGIIPSTDWNYYCLSPYSGMYQNIRFFQKLFIIIMILSVFLCILLTTLLMKPLLVHFSTLMKKINCFGNEDFELAEVPYSYKNRQDEIGRLHQQFDSMALKIQTLIKENYEANLSAKESQLKALEMQINPHFLYNTLQTINWRGKMLKDREISLMTESLGKLLRITLSRKNKDSSLKQELDLVRYYMNIQEIRYEDCLSYTISVPDSLLGLYLPKFILQPLVENAIHYSLEEDSDTCFIKITAYQENNRAIITVANTGSVFEEDLLEKLLYKKILPHGFGIGILNVHKRLDLAFGHSYSLEFFNQEPFAVVKISFPLIQEDKLAAFPSAANRKKENIL